MILLKFTAGDIRYWPILLSLILSGRVSWTREGFLPQEDLKTSSGFIYGLLFSRILARRIFGSIYLCVNVVNRFYMEIYEYMIHWYIYKLTLGYPTIIKQDNHGYKLMNTATYMFYHGVVNTFKYIGASTLSMLIYNRDDIHLENSSTTVIFPENSRSSVTLNNIMRIEPSRSRLRKVVIHLSLYEFTFIWWSILKIRCTIGGQIPSPQRLVSEVSRLLLLSFRPILNEVILKHIY